LAVGPALTAELVGVAQQPAAKARMETSGIRSNASDDV